MRFSTAESTVFTRPETQWAKIPPITSTIRSGERPMSVRNQPTTAAVPRAPSTIAMTGMPGPGNARSAVPQSASDFGVDPLANLSPQQLEVLAQIELRAKLANCILAVENCFRVGRCQQPVGEAVFAGAHQGGADPFKQRATAEDVEIGGVGMVVVEIRQALRSQPLPPTFEPAQAV